MSATEFFLSRGFTPINKTVVVSGVDTFTVWSPSTSMKIKVTELAVSTNLATTIAFYWGNLAGTKIAAFHIGGSTTISPSIGIWDGTMYDRAIFAKLGASSTDGCYVNVTGFETD